MFSFFLNRWHYISFSFQTKMATPASIARVLVRAKRVSDQTAVQMHFTQSLIDYLGDGKSNIMDLFTWVEPDPTHLIVSNTPKNPSDKKIRIKRPVFCPIHNMTPSQHSELDKAVYERGVDTGAVIMLESADNSVMLIRRGKNLRTFPNVWTPPGGHIEQGESIAEAGMRELEEETGLKVTEQMMETPIKELCLWESSFPPKLSAGLPRRHHLVIYLHCKLKHPYTGEHLKPHIKPDPREVDAYAWINRKIATNIVAAAEERFDEIKLDTNGSLSAMAVAQDRSLSPISVPLSVMYSTSKGEVEDTERVSTGTKWALENWLQRI